jgi:hypothetical protein
MRQLVIGDVANDFETMVLEAEKKQFNKGAPLRFISDQL